MGRWSKSFSAHTVGLMKTAICNSERTLSTVSPASFVRTEISNACDASFVPPGPQLCHSTVVKCDRRGDRYARDVVQNTDLGAHPTTYTFLQLFSHPHLLCLKLHAKLTTLYLPLWGTCTDAVGRRVIRSGDNILACMQVFESATLLDGMDDKVDKSCADVSPMYGQVSFNWR